MFMIFQKFLTISESFMNKSENKALNRYYNRGREANNT